MIYHPMVSLKKNKRIQTAKSCARWWLGCSIFCACFATLVVALRFLYPMPKYEELQDKEIVVEHLEHNQGKYNRGYVLYVRTGEEYNVTGRMDHSVFEDTLIPGTHAKIKYTQFNYFEVFGLQSNRFCAEEIIVDGVTICTYDGRVDIAGWIVIAFFYLLAVVGAFLYRYFMKNVKKRERRLSERRKKYNEKRYNIKTP